MGGAQQALVGWALVEGGVLRLLQLPPAPRWDWSGLRLGAKAAWEGATSGMKVQA